MELSPAAPLGPWIGGVFQFEAGISKPASFIGKCFNTILKRSPATCEPLPVTGGPYEVSRRASLLASSLPESSSLTQASLRLS